MSILARISAFLGLRNAARNPVQRQTRRSRKQKQKQPIKGGRFARQVIRSQRRRRYVPGQLGLSSVATSIANFYDGKFPSRRERKQIAMASQQVRPIFYGEG